MPLYTYFNKLAASGWNLGDMYTGGVSTRLPEYPDDRIIVTFDSVSKPVLACYIANTPQLRSRGLQGFDKIAKSDGVIFVFDEPGTVTFHMGEVKFPIDLMFIGQDSRVIKAVRNAKPGTSDKWSMGRVAIVVEAASGFMDENKVDVGSKIEIVGLRNKRNAQATFPNYPRPDVNPENRKDRSKTDPVDRFKHNDTPDVRLDSKVDRAIHEETMDGKHYKQTNGYDVVETHDDESKPSVRSSSTEPYLFSRKYRMDVKAKKAALYSSLAGTFVKSASGGLTKQNLGTKAIDYVHSYLSEFALPGTPKLSYMNARVASSVDSYDVDSGTIVVAATMHTPSGIRVDFDVPLNIINGQFLEPSMIVVNGEPRVLAQSTFDSLMQSCSIYDIKPDRKLYSPPSETSSRLILRRPSSGMFNTTTFRQLVSSKSYKSDDITDGCVILHETSSRSAGMFDDSLDPGESHSSRATEGHGTLAEELEVKDRGGVMYTYPKGTKVTILRDHTGDGEQCVVRFPDGLVCIVDCSCLR